MADGPTRYYFFSGKGGVGKTTMAAATAAHHADRGLKTLIVTTDPASNLADVFEQRIGHRVTAIDGFAHLYAMEIDVDTATLEYKERALAPFREAFPTEMVAVMEEQLNSPCTEEMAAFDKFVDFIDDQSWDVVIFDTAPTGHTIRLLELPVEWSRHIAESEEGSGQTCMGPVEVLKGAKEKYDRAVGLLRDPERTTFVFVLQPEGTSIAETKRAAAELAEIGIHSRLLVINGILPPDECTHPFFRKRSEMQQHYIREVETGTDLPVKKMYLLGEEVKGLDLLRLIARRLWGNGSAEAATEPTYPAAEADRPRRPRRTPATTGIRVEEYLFPKNGQNRAVFFAGKGGVGKTSLSCITGMWLARQGLRTLVVTTDPAAHLGEVFGQPVGFEITPLAGVENLSAVKIDPKREAEAYKKRILDDAAEKYAPEALAVIKEQLDSPCTEEMATFDKFLDYAASDAHEVVVFDTAPTGHTLRLLELPIDWSKQIELKSSLSTESDLLNQEAGVRFRAVIERMRDPDRTTFCFVVYPEFTPIMEAKRAVEELETVGITTRMVIANMVLPPEYCNTPYFASRRRMQEKHLDTLDEVFPGAAILEMPLLDIEVKGLDNLKQAADVLYDGAETKGVFPLTEADDRHGEISDRI